MTKHSPTRSIPPSEEGYILLFAVFLTALLVIALAVAAPKVAKSIQRDKDLETFNRGMQYRRAIQLYYKKFNAYPPNLDALVETNNLRFLRKKYTDPITRKDDWKPILFGQNKVPTAMGFFGQPLAGTTIAGIGPNGGNSANGGAGGGGILPGGISNLFGGGGNTSGGSNTSGGGGSGSTGDSGNSSGGTDTSGNSSGTSPNGGTNASNPTSPDASTQTFGGAGIIGFKPASEKKSILVYKKKQHYNEWEFTYDPISDRQVMAGGNAGNGLGSGNNGQTGGGTPFGSSSFGPGSNNTNGFGGTPGQSSPSSSPGSN